MSELTRGEPIDERVPWIRRMRALDDARAVGSLRGREQAIARSGRALGDTLRQGAKAVSVRTLPTSIAPYPVRFAFNGATWGFAPGAMLLIQNRSLLVQVATDEGIKNVLFNPTDGPANQATPFYQRLLAELPEWATKPLLPKPNRCAQQLRALGLSTDDIDVIAFDHFHTQDLRPLLGADGLAARFPNAYLLAPRVE